jgi:hypothetical protein
MPMMTIVELPIVGEIVIETRLGIDAARVIERHGSGDMLLDLMRRGQRHGYLPEDEGDDDLASTACLTLCAVAYLTFCANA